MTEQAAPATWDQDAEEAVLSAALLSDAGVAVLEEVCEPADFYRQSHRLIATAIRDLRKRRDPVDPISVNQRLAEMRTEDGVPALDAVGGRGTVLGLMGATPAAAHARRHAEIVHDKARSRRLVAACLDAMNRVAAGERPDDVARFLDERLAGAASHHDDIARRLLTLDELADEWLAETIADAESGGIRTPWPTISAQMPTPIHRGEVVLLAARTAVGKTWGLMAMMIHALQVWTRSSAILHSLEMPGSDIFERFGANAIHPLVAGRFGKLNSATEELRQMGVEERDPRRIWSLLCGYQPELGRVLVNDAIVSIDDVPRVLSRARRRGHDPALVAIDYAGLLEWRGPTRASTYEQVSATMRALKPLARRENVVLLVACQLSRAAGSGGTRPTLAMLRDSGASEEAADRVIGLWNPAEDEKRPDEVRAMMRDERLRKACLLKNRKGGTGAEATLFLDEAMRLVEAAPEESIG